MAFLDNTGLTRLWEHIVARFANREELEVLQGNNLLDNSNFVRAVRQREDYSRGSSIIVGTGSSSGSASGGGSTSTSSHTMPYLIDRWRASSSVTFTNGSGLIIPEGTHYFRQGLELGTFNNIEHTVVLTFSDDSKIGGIIDLTSNDVGSYTENGISFVMTKNYNSTYDKLDVTITNSTSSNLIVKNIAVYPGSYSTLPTYVKKPFAEERMRALQFFKRYNGSQLASRCTSGSLTAKLHFEIAFRTPSYELLVNNLGTIYANSKNTTGVTVQSIELNSAGIDTALLYIKTAASGLTSNDIGVWGAGSIGLDADYT